MWSVQLQCADPARGRTVVTAALDTTGVLQQGIFSASVRDRNRQRKRGREGEKMSRRRRKNKKKTALKAWQSHTDWKLGSRI